MGIPLFSMMPERIVIPDRVVYRDLQGLFGLFVKIEQHVGAIGADRRRVVYVVAAHDGKLRLECRDFLETQVAAVCRIELRFDVRVGEENEVEGAWGFCVC